jgi:ABC-type polysaccharide/polyol phosphate transport system ATPase subunit
MAFIELENLSLSYPILHSVDLNLKAQLRTFRSGGAISRGARRNSLEIRALVDINFRAVDGDRIGVIGHNGAGKTTFLKVLAGIYRPQRGTIRRGGYTVAVINPSHGLQPDFTGYQNIESIGLLSGLSLSEIQSRIPDIVEFTELGEFLALPVSTYSSGMQARLAFGVATSLKPEILIADENIGTGDARFMARAEQRMRAMMDQSSILVVASHSLATLQHMCNRAILFEHGKIIADGPVDKIAEQYLSFNNKPDGDTSSDHGVDVDLGCPAEP